MKHLTAVICLLACCPFLGQAAPAPKIVILRDAIGWDWRDELVHTDLEFAPGAVPGAATATVRTAAGEALPCQVTEVRRHEDGSIRTMAVWFSATVPANGEARYEVSAGGNPVGNGLVTVKETAGSVELTTRTPQPVGIRLVNGRHEFDWPVALAQDPGPVQALLLPSGRQCGRGRFDVPFKLKSRRTEVLAAGPLFAEVRVSYQFDHGYWTFTARVTAGCPMIQINEEFNNGVSDLTALEFDRFYSLVLNDGAFKPGQGWFAARTADPRLQDLAKDQVPTAWAATGREVQLNWVAGPVNGFTLKPDLTGDLYFLTGWPSVKNGIGNFIRLVEPGGDAVGFATLEIMGWRDPLAIRFHTAANGELSVRLPLQKYTQGWEVDGFGDGSPNYTGITLFVPQGCSRRSYGIMLSTAENEAEKKLESLMQLTTHLSAQTLDEVKDWTLDWPDPMAGAAWVAAPTPEGTKAVEIMRQRTRFYRLMGNLGTFSMGEHFAFAKKAYPDIAKAMNEPTRLTAGQRAELRRLVAFEAYRQNSDELFPYGAGMHLNNPNMTIMAVEARIKSSRLIQDHPEFKRWGTRSLELTKAFFERYTMSSGAPYENPHYTIGVSMDWAAEINQTLLDAGIGDAFDTDLFRSSMRFVLNWLTPPDPRFQGHRMLLPLGNGSYQSVPPTFAQQVVGYYKDRDPDLAGQLQWFANQTLPDDKKIGLVKDVSPTLGSGWFKDYGVIFRHGFGTPYETMVHFLAGRCFGHYEAETDQMVYSIFAKGQPVHLSFGNGYFPMFNRPWLRNRISFDRMMEMYERNRSEVEQASFSPQVEYFRAVRETDQLLPIATEYPLLDDKNRWTPEENANWTVTATAKPRQIPLTLWYRQMLFLKDPDPKGPNYFVLRDDFGGRPIVPTDLSLWFLAERMEREGDVFHFVGQCKADMDVFVNTPATFTPHTDRYGHQQQAYVRLVGFDPAYFPEGKLREDQLLLRLHQEPGKPYLVVLYPRLKENDPPAQYARLSDTVVKVTTPISEDYVFLSPFQHRFKDDRVTFSGLAATVRFFKDGRTFVANAEGATEIQVAGKTVTGDGPFVVTLGKGPVDAQPAAPTAKVQVR